MSYRTLPIGFVVLARDRKGVVQHEQPFYLGDFLDAKIRAFRHADKIAKCFPGHEVAVEKIVRAEA